MKKVMLLVCSFLAFLPALVFPQAGNIDNSFGAGGQGSTASIGNSQIWAMAIQDDWSIVVGGFANNGIDSSFALARYTSDGLFDATFGNDGIVLTAPGHGNGIIRAVAVQPDGKIVAAGSAWNGTKFNFALTRYNTNGSLDSTFGTNGIVITNVGPGDDIATSLLMFSDWSVVIGGSSLSGISTNFTLVKYKINGAIDSTFGLNGITTTAVGPGNDDLNALAFQNPDSGIIAVGTSYNDSLNNFALARYKKNGTLDNTFGSPAGGTVVTTGDANDDEAFAVVVQQDNKIIVAGYSGGASDSFGLIRYNPNGQIDGGFGTHGKVTTQIAAGDSNDHVYGLLLQSDQKIVAAGSSFQGGIGRYAIARYNTNGQLDTQFGTGGKSSNALGAGSSVAYAVALQHDNSIISAGYTEVDNVESFSVAAYVSGLAAPCSAIAQHFAVTDKGQASYRFSDESYSPDSSAVYSWTIDGLTVSDSAAFNHTFAVAQGDTIAYTICESISEPGCTDTAGLCLELYATFMNSAGACATIMQEFVSVNTATGVFAFADSSRGLNNNAAYNWLVNKALESNSPSFNYTFIYANQPYTVCETISEPGCPSTSAVCEQITGAAACQTISPYFNIIYNGNGSYTFSDSTTRLSLYPNSNNYWTINNVNSSNNDLFLPGFNYQFPSPGNYVICENISLGECGDTVYCQNVQSVYSSIENISDAATIRLYPNPASNAVTFETGNLAVNEIELFNDMGQKLVAKQTGSARKIVFDLEAFSPGLYLASIHLNGNEIAHKLFVICR